MSQHNVQLSVGWLRQQIEGLADSVVIRPDWEYGPPSDSEPCVVLHGIHVRRPGAGPPEVIVRVSTVSLDESES